MLQQIPPELDQAGDLYGIQWREPWRRCRRPKRRHQTFLPLLDPFKPNNLAVQALAQGRTQSDRRIHHTDKVMTRSDERVIKIGADTSQPVEPWEVPNDSSMPSARPATVRVSTPDPSLTEMPRGSGSFANPFWFSTTRRG